MAKFFGLVFGSQPEQPKALEVNVDTVYVRNNIERVVAKDEGEFEGWQYEETQYNLKEFQEVVSNQVTNLEDSSVGIVMSMAEQTMVIEEQRAALQEMQDLNAQMVFMIAELTTPVE